MDHGSDLQGLGIILLLMGAAFLIPGLLMLGGDPDSMSSGWADLIASAILISGGAFCIPGLILILVGSRGRQSEISLMRYCPTCKIGYRTRNRDMYHCPACEKRLKPATQCEYCSNWFTAANPGTFRYPNCNAPIIVSLENY